MNTTMTKKELATDAIQAIQNYLVSRLGGFLQKGLDRCAAIGFCVETRDFYLRNENCIYALIGHLRLYFAN